MNTAKREETIKAASEFFMIKASNKLPEAMDELVPIMFIGEAAVTYYKKRIQAMNSLGICQEQRDATLKDAQDVAEMLLDIEARIGKLLPDPSRVPKKDTALNTFEKELPQGIDRHKAYQARKLSENPEVVERLKAQARGQGEIITVSSVINQIYKEKEKARREKVKELKRPKIIMTLEQSSYMIALDQCILHLPNKPPENWEEDALKVARAKAKIIISRLEVFND